VGAARYATIRHPRLQAHTAAARMPIFSGLDALAAHVGAHWVEFRAGTWSCFQLQEVFPWLIVLHVDF
jgi:hypothetical protein